MICRLGHYPTPGGIERQEAEGQREFVSSETLPLDCPREQLEKLGFEFGDAVDELFVKVRFPSGWTKRATEHSMWSDLIDPHGRKRGGIFYKAAFYDRKAHMGLDCRITTATTYLDAIGKIHDWRQGEPIFVRHAVIDCAEGKAIFTCDPIPEDDRISRKKAEDQSREWIASNFPDHMNPVAYW